MKGNFTVVDSVDPSAFFHRLTSFLTPQAVVLVSPNRLGPETAEELAG